MKMLMQYTPFLPQRVAVSTESIEPLVQWRLGRGAAPLFRVYRPTPAFRAVWIGDPHASSEPPETRTIVLYVHGGGFALGSVALYSELLLRLLSHMSVDDPSRTAECVALEYDLVPQVRFPTPLLQLLHCYAYLIEEERIPASRIVVAGDSAGGNLAMSLLLCLAGQATADVNERDWSAFPMPAKAVLISPWLDLRPHQAKAVEAVRTHIPPTLDILTPECLVQFAQLYTHRLGRPRRMRGPCTRWLTWLQHRRRWRLAAWLAERLARPLFTRRYPIVPLQDALSDAVPRISDLLDASSLAAEPVCAADQLLHAHPLVSPTLGRWDAVRLEQGLFVTWGEHEWMAPDIAAWAARLPLVDTFVEPGTTGVHVWPFLHALLASSERERERGLQILAHALCVPAPDRHVRSPA